MKTRSRILLLVVLVFFGCTQLFSQQDTYPETAIIKLVEYHDGTVGDNSKLIIVKPDNTVETKVLDKARIRGDGEGITANLVKLRIEIQIWQNNGFEIVSTAAASPVNGAVTMTTVFLQKK